KRILGVAASETVRLAVGYVTVTLGASACANAAKTSVAAANEIASNLVIAAALRLRDDQQEFGRCIPVEQPVAVKDRPQSMDARSERSGECRRAGHDRRDADHVPIFVEFDGTCVP